jgi:universal stress protein E
LRPWTPDTQTTSPLLDNHILDCASAVAKRLDGELHADIPTATVVAAAAGNSPMTFSFSAAELAFEGRRAGKQVAELVAEYRVDAARIHIGARRSRGSPAANRRLTTRRHFGHGRHLAQWSATHLHRQTADDVLERLPCDALIVKSLDFAALLPF